MVCETTHKNVAARRWNRTKGCLGGRRSCNTHTREGGISNLNIYRVMCDKQNKLHFVQIMLQIFCSQRIMSCRLYNTLLKMIVSLRSCYIEVYEHGSAKSYFLTKQRTTCQGL